MSPEFGIGKPPQAIMDYDSPRPEWENLGVEHKVIIVFDGPAEAAKAAEAALNNPQTQNVEQPLETPSQTPPAV